MANAKPASQRYYLMSCFLLLMAESENPCRSMFHTKWIVVFPQNPQSRDMDLPYTRPWRGWTSLSGATNSFSFNKIYKIYKQQKRVACQLSGYSCFHGYARRMQLIDDPDDLQGDRNGSRTFLWGFIAKNAACHSSPQIQTAAFLQQFSQASKKMRDSFFNNVPSFT